jgi:YHS domain-containing protein
MAALQEDGNRTYQPGVESGTGPNTPSITPHGSRIMLHRATGLAVILAGTIGLSGLAADPPEKKLTPEEAAKAKKALQEVQDFIGVWNLEGTQKTGAKTEAWKDQVSWGWRFKGDDAWINVTFKDAKGEGKAKYYAKGELRYLVKDKKYQLTLTDLNKAEQVFVGEQLKNGGLKMERKDAQTGDAYRLTLNTLADGVRFQFKLEKQDGGKGLFATAYQMNGNKDGESIAGSAKKPECIVTGGAATIQVSYQGKTFYVCCTGCRDAFNENPEKFIKAAAKK